MNYKLESLSANHVMGGLVVLALVLLWAIRHGFRPPTL